MSGADPTSFLAPSEPEREIEAVPFRLLPPRDEAGVLLSFLLSLSRTFPIFSRFFREEEGKIKQAGIQCTPVR